MTARRDLDIVRFEGAGSIGDTVRERGVELARPVLVMVGGASGMDLDGPSQLGILVGRLVSALDRWGVAVIDGGTDAGVMRLMGRARRAAGASFPLIGVAARGTVALPGTGAVSAPDAVAPEEHHSHLILVPGERWGDESRWLSSTATAVAAGKPSVTLLANGGAISVSDALTSLDAGRAVIVLAGTGRVADAVAGAGEARSVDRSIARIAASPLTRVVPVADTSAVLDAIAEVLGTGTAGEVR